MGQEQLLSDESEEESSDSEFSESTMEEGTPGELKRIGVDVSMGKEGELFWLGIKT